ncbi:hypothetical protein [Bacillus solimangrovi]|nr:hypothetical protein [Bacillus solimangrovi]
MIKVLLVDDEEAGLNLLNMLHWVYQAIIEASMSHQHNIIDGVELLSE